MLQLCKAAAALDVSHYYGFISSVGKDVNGDVHVEFIVTDNAPQIVASSKWPQWAYELALQALFNKNKLLVLCDGPLLGNNLIKIIVLNKDLFPLKAASGS